MDSFEKLKILGQASKYDMCGCGRPNEDDYIKNGIYRVHTPDGICSIFKVLLTNKCHRDCAYCVNRFENDTERTSFTPEELAKVFMEVRRRHSIQGLFLSSAIDKNPDSDMSSLIDTAKILRTRYNFKGYIHMKVMPGASRAAIEEASKVANRLSLNIEVPSERYMERLTRAKRFGEILNGMSEIKRLKDKGIRVSQTTQFIVGAAGESDREIVDEAYRLKREFNLARVYFSAFRPVEGTPMEGKEPTPLMREYRLYQVDFLFSQYGFKPEDLSYEKDGNLPMDKDPKYVFALNHPEIYPVEINTADYNLLLLVPGIGPVSAKRILERRVKDPYHSIDELKGTGTVLKRARPFITINGKSFTEENKPKQLSFI
jgi:Radical SAM superfamily.